jgi:hypothetical protein
MRCLIAQLPICLLVMSGCAAPVATIDYYSVDTATLQKIKPMKIVDEASLASGDYKALGKVTGFHCKRTSAGGYGGAIEGPRQTAIDQLRLRAAKKGASHISTPECAVNETLDLANNCWASIRCTSTALRM